MYESAKFFQRCYHWGKKHTSTRRKCLIFIRTNSASGHFLRLKINLRTEYICTVETAKFLIRETKLRRGTKAAATEN